MRDVQPLDLEMASTSEGYSSSRVVNSSCVILSGDGTAGAIVISAGVFAPF